MNKKILYGFLPIFLSLVVMFVPIRVDAAVGVGSIWDGTYNVDFVSPIIYLDYTHIYDYLSGGGTVKPTYVGAIYSGSGNLIVDIDSNSTGVYLNGTFNARVSLSVQRTLNSGSKLSVTAQPVVLNGIYVSVLQTSRDELGNAVFDIIVEFDNYYVEQSTISLPLKIDYQLNTYIRTVENTGIVAESIVYIPSVYGDYHGDIMQYDNLEDVPSVDGYFAEQNQTIIDQSQTQNNLTNQQNTLIQNQTSQQHQDSQAEINQSIQNIDQITNGYNSGVMGDAENKFESGAGDLTDIEDTLTDSSSTYVDNFTNSGFDTSFLQSVGPSLNYVVTWFTNFWNMGGALTSTYGLSFAIFIAFYILRVRG